MVYWTWLVPTSVTEGIMRRGSLTFEVERYLGGKQIRMGCRRIYGWWCYLINSNSPSGGMKLMVRVASKSVNLTHWWNRQSSNSTASVVPFSFRSMTSLSLRPNLHSGVPERYALIWMWPSTSARRTLPAGDQHGLTEKAKTTHTLGTHAEIYCLDNVDKRFVFLVLDICSSPANRTSGLGCDLRRLLLNIDVRVENKPRKIRLRRTAAMDVETMLSVVIYDFKVSISLFWGYPKSLISVVQD